MKGAAEMLVVDSSILLSAFLPDEDGPDLAALVAPHDDLIAPWLLWIEVRNILLTAQRRGRLTDTFADEILDAIEGLGVSFDTAPRSDAVLHLARSHGLTAYDSLYLELALRRQADLATLDHALQRAARAEGVPLAAAN